MTRAVQAAGARLAVEERGAGVPVLLLHGAGFTRRGWDETVAALGDSVRAISYDRRGYGDSEAPEPYGGTTVEEQAEDAAAVLEALDAAPAVLCGHGLGATIALDLACRRPGLVRSVLLIEPPLFALSPRGSETLGGLRERIERAAGEGGPERAVDAFLEAAAGMPLAEALGPERTAAGRTAVRAVLADFGAAAGWSFGRRMLRAVDRPALVLRGRESPAVWREVAGSLAELLPAGELRETAGHVPQLDAPADVAAAIRELA